jgi:hypothetical protein
VLHKLGCDLVKDRVMRVNYGTSYRTGFREGYHPVSRKVMGFDGRPKCSGVMHWFVKKVLNSWFHWLKISGRKSCKRYGASEKLLFRPYATRIRSHGPTSIG